MTERFDVIVVGGGHNGLVAATYLAKAGRRTLLLEAAETAGGSLGTVPVGDRTGPMAFATADNLHPSVIRDLSLERHGLGLEEGSGVLVLGEGEPLWLPAGDVAANLEPADRDGLAELQRLCGRTVAALEPVMSEALPELEQAGTRDLFDLLIAGWRLRRLGRRDMPDAVRLLTMTLRDITEEHLADERLRAAIAWPALRGTWLAPWSAGGGFALLYHHPAWRPDLLAPPRHIAGGSGALVAALTAAAQEAGVEIRTGVAVTEIQVADDRVTGVVAGGSGIAADAVISACDPTTTLLDLLPPGWLDPSVRRAAHNIRYRATVATARFALRDLPALPVADAATARVQIGNSLVALEKAFDPAKYQELPERPALDLTFAATDQGPVAHVWAQHVAAGASASDAQREAVMAALKATIEAAIPGFGGLIEAESLSTPNDFARDLGIRGGHLYHGELGLDQVLFMRPIPGMYDHTTPVEGLYLGGPGAHPGGGVTGLPGKLAAARLLSS